MNDVTVHDDVVVLPGKHYKYYNVTKQVRLQIFYNILLNEKQV